MATPKPGEIRCPTCHRSTPPAAYCTKCGTAIPTDARARPRGMDRDELQERIRARRSGGDPYRRGNLADDEYGGFERFEPEPEDAGARRRTRGQPGRRSDDLADAAPAAAAPVWGERNNVVDDRRDLTRDDYTAPIAPPRDRAAAAPPPTRVDEPVEDYPPDAEEVLDGDARADYYGDPYDDAAAYPYPYDEWGDERERRSSGTGAFAILGFLALGVLALLGGAFLAGIFSDDDGVGIASPSPSVAASVAPSVHPVASAVPSAAASTSSTAQPEASGAPVDFADGATFEIQACVNSDMSFDGCSQEAEVFETDSFTTWVGFSGASGSDRLVLILREEGNALADAEFVLGESPFGCTTDCVGYARQGFTGIPPGEYSLELLRNGELADTTSVVVQ